MKKWICRLIEDHKFFIRESKLFVGDPNEMFEGEWVSSNPNARKSLAKNHHYKFKDMLYFPIAYFKFMFYNIRKY